MATVTDKLTPAQVAAACALYIRRGHAAKNIPVPDEAVFLCSFDAHTMKGEVAVPDAFDHILVSYEVG